jgi:D-sedoheptulose 7-phosphate isomerase
MSIESLDDASLHLETAALLRQEFAEHRRVSEATEQMVSRPFGEALDILEAGIRGGGKLLLFGNGGSAADAQHIAAELIVRYRTDRPSICAVALTTDSSVLTACGNDMGFDTVFERQIDGLGRKGDVAIGISTSGNSPNVLKALIRARAMGLHTVGLTGGTGGRMQSLCDALIVVPSAVTARIQEMHITIGHILCMALERRLGLVLPDEI